MRLGLLVLECGDGGSSVYRRVVVVPEFLSRRLELSEAGCREQNASDAQVLFYFRGRSYLTWIFSI